MFIRLIKNNNTFGLILILLIGVLFWFNSFQSPPDTAVLTGNGMPFYLLLFNLLNKFPVWQVYTGFLLVVVNSIMITRLCSTFLLFKKGFRLPGILYISLISSWVTLQTLHPVHLAAFCVLVAFFYIFYTYQKELEISFTFNASFLFALASLFYLPAIVLLPLIWVSIFVLQKTDNWRLLVVPLLGFTVPWLFAFSITYMSDSLRRFITTISSIIWADNNAYLFEPFFLVMTGMIIILVLIGSFTFLTNYQLIKVSSRKYFVVFYWMMGLVGISALAFTTIGIEIIALSTIPSAILISIFFLSGERHFWKELIFLIFISLLLYGYIIR